MIYDGIKPAYGTKGGFITKPNQYDHKYLPIRFCFLSTIELSLVYTSTRHVWKIHLITTVGQVGLCTYSHSQWNRNIMFFKIIFLRWVMTSTNTYLNCNYATYCHFTDPTKRKWISNTHIYQFNLPWWFHCDFMEMGNGDSAYRGRNHSNCAS